VGYTPGGEHRKIASYIKEYFHVGTHKMSGQILIWDIRDITLNTILLRITRDASSMAPRLT
jgi:hypothetical protein